MGHTSFQGLSNSEAMSDRPFKLLYFDFREPRGLGLIKGKFFGRFLQKSAAPCAQRISLEPVLEALKLKTLTCFDALLLNFRHTARRPRRCREAGGLELAVAIRTIRYHKYYSVAAVAVAAQ